MKTILKLFAGIFGILIVASAISIGVGLHAGMPIAEILNQLCEAAELIIKGLLIVWGGIVVALTISTLR